MNQRDFVRIDMSDSCTVRLSKLGERILPLEDPFEVKLHNISGGGLSFESSRDLPGSPLLTWQFRVKILDKTFDLYGQLVWKKAVENLYHYGVRFIFVDGNQQKDLIYALNLYQSRQRMKEKLVKP